MRTRNLSLALLTSVFTLIAGPSSGSAQVVGAGTVQLDFGGNITVFTEGDQDFFGTVAAGLTRFQSESFEWGGYTSLFWSEGESSGVGGILFGVARWNFVGQSLWVPWLGIGAGTAFVDGEVIGGLSGGFFAGVRRFLDERVSFNITTQQRFQLSDGDFAWSEFTEIPITFGFSVYW